MNIKAKYLNIKWRNKDEITEIKENHLSEKVECLDDYTYFLQLYTYTKIDSLFAQIAFQIDEEDIVPAILLGNGRKKKLKKIINPDTNEIWWIENEWDKIKKYYESKFINRIGDTKIFFGDTVLNINIKMINLTEDDIEIMLDAFKNELWKLIFNQKSYSNIKIKSSSTGIREKYKHVLEEYIGNIDKILNKPKVALKEYFIKENIKKIIPTTKTFTEYISDPGRQYYTGKSKIENYNIPDNQFIYWTLKFIKQLLQNNISYQKYTKKTTLRRIDEYKKKIDDINEILDNKQLDIDRDLFLQDIDNLSKEKDELVAKVLSNTKNIDNKESKTITINISNIGVYEGKKFFESKTSDVITSRFFCKQFDDIIKEHHKGEYEITYNDFLFLESEKTFINLSVPDSSKYHIVKSMKNGIKKFVIYDKNNNQKFKDYFFKISLLYLNKKNNKYVCEIDLDCTKQFDKIKGKLSNIYCTFYSPPEYRFEEHISCDEYFLINSEIFFNFPYEIKNIIAFKPTKYDNMIAKLQKQAVQYEKNNWKRKLDINNRSDQEIINYLKQEHVVMENNYVKMNENYNKLLNEDDLAKLNNKILKQDSLFQSYGIHSSSVFPNTMTYIQNHLYHEAYKNFNILLDMQNIDVKQLEQIQFFEKNITIENMPKVYERWCLLIVINTLMEYFNFKPKQNNWISLLLQQILYNQHKGVKIELENQQLECNVTVWYEKELKSKKLPDIMLEIKYSHLYPYKIIFDAKFHEKTDIKHLIKELYYKKDYAEKELIDIFDEKSNINYNNQVFILHPDLQSMARNGIKINSQKWGEVSYLGEGILFSTQTDRDNIQKMGDSIVSNHRYGAIVVNPKNFSYQTMLQRLIGMCLQYYPYKNTGDIPKKWLCIACGNINDESDYYYKHLDKIRGKCKNCGNVIVYTQCFSCQTKLIKNGIFWTYHNTSEENIYNIKCPNCNSFFTKELSELYYKKKQNIQNYNEDYFFEDY